MSGIRPTCKVDENVLFICKCFYLEGLVEELAAISAGVSNNDQRNNYNEVFLKVIIRAVKNLITTLFCPNSCVKES